MGGNAQDKLKNFITDFFMATASYRMHKNPKLTRFQSIACSSHFCSFDSEIKLNSWKELKLSEVKNKFENSTANLSMMGHIRVRRLRFLLTGIEFSETKSK